MIHKKGPRSTFIIYTIIIVIHESCLLFPPFNILINREEQRHAKNTHKDLRLIRKITSLWWYTRSRYRKSVVLQKSISAEAVGRRSWYAFLRTRLCDMLLVYHQSDVIFRLSLYKKKIHSEGHRKKQQHREHEALTNLKSPPPIGGA